MLSISLPMKGHSTGEYYLRLAHEDYYFSKEATAVWHGRGAGRLGLLGRIDPDPFRRLLDGYSPDGRRQLVQNAGHEKKTAGWDLTFSAPKGVSTLWAMSDERVRHEIEAAHREAVVAALDFLQEKAGITRRGKGGESHEPADVMFALFEHNTSREQDPQIHTHAFLINVCIRQDGTTGAIWSQRFFDYKMEAGGVYATMFAERLQRRLGLEIEPATTGFHIAEVPHELCDIFSKRRAQILAFLAEHGESGAIAAKHAALSTRRRKSYIASDELFAAWRKTGEEFGWGMQQADEFIRRTEASQKARDQQAAASLDQNSSQGNSSTRSHRQPDDAEGAQATQNTSQENTRDSDAKRSQSTAGDTAGREKKKQRRTRTRESERKRQQSSRKGRTERASKRQRKRSQDKTSAANEGGSQKDSRRYRTKRQRLFRVEWQPVFPKAPKWNPLHKWQVPKVVVGRDRQRRSKWGRVIGRKNLWLAELRLQQRYLFPNAPAWNPAKNWALPRVRIMPKSIFKKQTDERTKSYGQSH